MLVLILPKIGSVTLGKLLPFQGGCSLFYAFISHQKETWSLSGIGSLASVNCSKTRKVQFIFSYQTKSMGWNKHW